MDKEKNLVEQLTSTPEGMRLFQQEGLILEVSEEIFKRMGRAGKSRMVEMAKAVGIDPKGIEKMLDGDPPLNLRQIADIFTYLGHRARIATVPLEIPMKQKD